MTDKVQKIRKEVERLKRWNDNVRESTRHMTVQEEDYNRGKNSSYLELMDFIDSIQEEPVNKDFEMALAEMIDKAQKCVVEPLVIAAQWKDELIKLAKSEEPASESIDFEQELYKAFGQIKDFTLGIAIAKRFYDMGRKHAEKQMGANTIDAQCFGFQGAALFSFRLPADNYLVGSKVKVIVIKED